MRLAHIDRMRAIAVLCMVQVHTAAIVPPRGMTVGDPAAFVAAAVTSWWRRWGSLFVVALALAGSAAC